MSGTEIATWEQWIKWYAQIYGWTRDDGLARLSHWADIMVYAKYDLTEVVEATLWIASHEPPEYPSDHLRSIIQRIRSRRFGRTPVVQEIVAQVKSCEKCNGEGSITVPANPHANPNSWQATESQHLFCTCDLGRTKGMRWEKRTGLPFPDLRAHEEKYPDWLDRYRWARKEKLRKEQAPKIFRQVLFGEHGNAN